MEGDLALHIKRQVNFNLMQRLPDTLALARSGLGKKSASYT